jgi:hypothetical protein
METAESVITDLKVERYFSACKADLLVFTDFKARLITKDAGVCSLIPVFYSIFSSQILANPPYSCLFCEIAQ